MKINTLLAYMYPCGCCADTNVCFGVRALCRNGIALYFSTFLYIVVPVVPYNWLLIYSYSDCNSIRLHLAIGGLYMLNQIYNFIFRRGCYRLVVEGILQVCLLDREWNTCYVSAPYLVKTPTRICH